MVRIAGIDREVAYAAVDGQFRGALSLSTWDARNAGRAALVTALALVVVTLATAASDEGGVAWGVRAGRSLPVAPVCAAFGTWLALAPARTRSEMLALEALGRAPQINALGAVLGGAAVAIACALAVASAPRLDVTGFYPTVLKSDDIRFEDGHFVDRSRGVTFEADGTFTKVPNEAGESAGKRGANDNAVPRGGRSAAALTIALAGIALPILAACIRRRAWPHVTAAALCVPATVLLFHASAAHRLGAYAAPLPSLALTLFAVASYRRWAWETERESPKALLPRRPPA
jgi:hypothetical protein